MSQLTNLKEAKEIIREIIGFNLNNKSGSNSSYLSPMLWSLPGEGKSTMMSDLISEMGLQEIQLIAAQFDAAELGGFPMVDKDNNTYYRARPFFMPTEGRGVIVCDELPQAPVAVQNVIAQLVNERRIGEHRLPEGWTVICAGNPMAAKAGTQAMPSHLRDRLMHINLTVDIDVFRTYALSREFDPRITSYLHERPEWIQKFDPKQNASPSPRSWERVNSVLSLPLSPTQRDIAIAGYIGDGALTDFSGFLRMWDSLPKVDDVLADPKNHKIPESPAILYALCSSLAHRATDKNIMDITTFIGRFPNKEFTLFCSKDIMMRHGDLKKNSKFMNWLLETGAPVLF